MDKSQYNEKIYLHPNTFKGLHKILLWVTILTRAVDYVLCVGGVVMNMTEVARLLLGLRAAGWTEKEINDFVLYIESGDEQYKPTNKREKSE